MWWLVAVACTPAEMAGGSAGVGLRGGVLPPPPASALGDVVVNEVQADNESTWQDPATGDTPDWVELYNRGEVAVPLDRIQLLDSSGDSWTGGDGLLEPGERLLLLSDVGDDPLPFDLGSDGGEALVVLTQGVRTDTVPLGVLGDDLALARFPDGGAWLPTARATPGWTNGSAPSATLDPADTLFATYVLHEIAIQVRPDLFDELDGRTEVEAQALVDGILFERVGLRNTGQGSFDPMTGKPRLLVDLNEYEAGRRFRGVQMLELHNGKTRDPTLVRDWVSYELPRLAGIPSSRVGWAHVTVNGDDYGLYVLVENTDDEFIEARFPDQLSTAMIFEGSSDFSWATSASSFDYEEGPSPPDPAGLESVEAVIDIVQGPANEAAIEALWRVVNKDAFLDYVAFEGISDHWDGYDAPHNWRFFVDGETHQLSWMPAGVEISWTGNPNLWGSNGSVAAFCIDVPSCKHDYAEHVLKMADLLNAHALGDAFDDLFLWLEPEIAADPKKFETMDVVRDNVANSSLHLHDNGGEARQDVFATFPDLAP